MLSLSKTSISSNDLFKLLLVLLSIIVLKILAVKALYLIFFLVFFLLIVRSKSPLFWFLFTFIYSDNPAGLFDKYSFSINISGFFLDFSFILIIGLLLNVINKKPTVPIIFKGIINLFIITIGINILVGAIMGMGDFSIIFRNIKNLEPFALIFILFRIFKSETDLVYIFKTIFPFVIISFLGQVFIFFYGYPVSTFLFPNEVAIFEIDATEQLSRVVYSIVILSLSLMGAMYFFNVKDNRFNKSYLLLIFFLSYFSLLISGTRTWTVGFGISILIWIFFSGRNAKTIILYSIIIFVLGLGVFLYSPVIQKQFELSISRISTVEKVAEGDLTVGGTAVRFNKRAPRILNAFKATNPVFGAGFSKFYYSFDETHLGHHNLLLQSGIWGIFIFYFLIIRILLRSISLYSSTKNKKTKFGFLAAGAILFGFLIIQTTTVVFSYLISPAWGAGYAIILVFISFFNQFK